MLRALAYSCNEEGLCFLTVDAFFTKKTQNGNVDAMKYVRRICVRVKTLPSSSPKVIPAMPPLLVFITLLVSMMCALSFMRYTRRVRCVFTCHAGKPALNRMQESGSRRERSPIGFLKPSIYREQFGYPSPLHPTDLLPA
jgi:hypothetical protein